MTFYVYGFYMNVRDQLPEVSLLYQGHRRPEPEGFHKYLGAVAQVYIWWPPDSKYPGTRGELSGSWSTWTESKTYNWFAKNEYQIPEQVVLFHTLNME